MARANAITRNDMHRLKKEKICKSYQVRLVNTYWLVVAIDTLYHRALTLIKRTHVESKNRDNSRNEQWDGARIKKIKYETASNTHHSPLSLA